MSSSSSASFSIITAAVAEWVDVHSTKHLGCHPQHPLMLEVQIKPSSHTAVLQLRVPIGLKDYILKQYIYLIISPEQLQSIHVSTKADVPPSVREALADRGSTHPFTSVRFSMGGPTMLVGPTAGNPRLKSHSSELAMDALCSLSLATDITLYVCEGAIPDAHLDAFCSLCDGSFRSVRDNLKTLYSGKGAKVIDRPTNAAESPPSYDELALSSPPPLAGKPSTPTHSPAPWTDTELLQAHRRRDPQPARSERVPLKPSRASRTSKWKTCCPRSRKT